MICYDIILLIKNTPIALTHHKLSLVLQLSADKVTYIVYFHSSVWCPGTFAMGLAKVFYSTSSYSSTHCGSETEQAQDMENRFACE